MATSIGSSASFTFGNMKPASGEQIDSLWGQNIADNTGFLRKQPIMFTSLYGSNGQARSATTFGAGDFTMSVLPQILIYRASAHNYIVGTWRGYGTFEAHGYAPDCYATQGVLLYGDLATYNASSGFGTANIGADFTFATTFTFSLALDTYLSVGSWGTLVGYFSGTSADAAPAGSTRVIKYEFDPAAKVYTTWAN